MKRLIAIAAVLGLTALAVAYVALAPISLPGHAGNALAVPNDMAARLIAIRGRNAAMLGLLVPGLVLSALAALALRKGASARATAPRRQAKPVEKPQPGPVWRAQPLPEDRIANLRRRALGEESEDTDAPAAPLPPPVMLVRKARDRDRDWFSDGSWLGGLPRLGEAEWPRDASGTPLPFAAQIDIAALGTICPESPLPRAGSLAFFLGTGAVVAVPAGAHDFSEPPVDLPPAFDEGGSPFPAMPNRLSRHFFPFWPVETVVLDLPEDLRDYRDGSRDEAIEAAMAELLPHLATPRSHTFTANGDTLWWHGIVHLADRLHGAFDGAARLVALSRERMRRAEEMLELIGGEGDADDPTVAAIHEELDREQEVLDAIEAQRSSLPDVITALDQFTADRDPWQALTVEECVLVEDLLTELHTSYGEVLGDHTPQTARELATLSVRTMITGAPDALAALPEDELARINRDYRLPLAHQHQMFGLGGLQSARDIPRGDILLLQLGYDDMMEWRWDGTGLFQFWISPEDAAAGNWDAVQLTFTPA